MVSHQIGKHSSRQSRKSPIQGQVTHPPPFSFLKFRRRCRRRIRTCQDPQSLSHTRPSDPSLTHTLAPPRPRTTFSSARPCAPPESVDDAPSDDEDGESDEREEEEDGEDDDGC